MNNYLISFHRKDSRFICSMSIISLFYLFWHLYFLQSTHESKPVWITPLVITLPSKLSKHSSQVHRGCLVFIALEITIEGLRATMCLVCITCFAKMYCIVSHAYRSMLWTKYCDKIYVIIIIKSFGLLPILIRMTNLKTSNVSFLNIFFKFNTMLHGAPEICIKYAT